MENLFSNIYENPRQESYLDKLFRLMNPEIQKPKEFSADISAEDAAEIMSDKFIEAVKIQLEKSKKKIEKKEEAV